MSSFALGARRSGSALVVPAAALFLSLVLFGLFVACAGVDPLAVYTEMYRGAFGSAFSIENTLQRAAPLLLTALCTAIPARLGLIVIGGEGALVLGGLAAALAAHTIAPTAGTLTLIVAGLAAFVAGGALVAASGALRAYRGVNEVIGSLLLNYIAIAVFNHLVEGPFRDPASLNKPSTVPLADSQMLGPLFGLDVHWGLGYGVIACVLAYVLLQKTTFGFSARVVGGNVRTARLCGLPVGRLVVLGSVLGGGAAGLAGMVEVTAVHGTANASLIAGYGYTGVLVSFLARHHPLAIIPVSILLGGIRASGGLLQRSLGLPDAAVGVLQGILFVVLLASEALGGRLPSLRRRPVAVRTKDAAPAVEGAA